MALARWTYAGFLHDREKDMEMKDSGARQQFEGGAQRDTAEGKPPMHLLSPHVYNLLLEYEGPVADGSYTSTDDDLAKQLSQFVLTADVGDLRNLLVMLTRTVGIERLCEWLRQGSIKYSAFNWAKGMPFTRVLDSALRHIAKTGHTDEDHGAALFCNAMFLYHYIMEIRAGRLDPKWDDRFDFRLTGVVNPSLNYEQYLRGFDANTKEV